MEIKSIIILGQSEIEERRKSLGEGIGWVVPDLHEKCAGVRHTNSKQCRSLKKIKANEIKKRKTKFCCSVARGSAPEQLLSVRIDPLPSAVSELTLSGFGGARRSTPMWVVLEVGLGVRADHPG